MAIEQLEESHRRLAAIADRMSGEYYRRLMGPVLPAVDVASLVSPMPNIAAVLDAGQKAAAMMTSPSIIESMVRQQQDVPNLLAVLGRTPIADLAKWLEIRNSVVFVDMPNVGAEIAASLDAGRKAAAIMPSRSIIESIVRQQDGLVRQLGSIGRLPAAEMLGAMDLRSTAIFDTSRRLGMLVHSDYFKGLMRSLSALPSQMLGSGRLADSFFSYLRDLRPLEWLAARELVERGWWLVPTWSTTLITRLLSERDERKCSMGVVLAEHYRKQKCRELGRLVRAWHLPEFNVGRRAGLFEDALKHQRDRQFRTVILSLTAQLEGILKDFLINEGLCVPADVDGTSPPRLFAKHLGGAREPSMTGFAHQFKLIYSHFSWPDPAPGRRVRRHPQMHGREVPRKSEQEALRLWLMLETLHYHLARVRALRRTDAA